MAELLQNISNWQEEGSYVLLITFFVSFSITLLVSHCYTDKHQSTPKYTYPLSTWTNTVTSERWYGWARGSETLFGWQVEVASVHSLLKVERRRVLLDRFLHAAHEQEDPWTLSDCMWLSVLGSLCRLSYLLATVASISVYCGSCSASREAAGSHDVQHKTTMAAR